VARLWTGVVSCCKLLPNKGIDPTLQVLGYHVSQRARVMPNTLGPLGRGDELQCYHCTKPAMFLFGGDEGEGGMPLCLDCQMKVQALLTQRLENDERAMNYLGAQIESTVGLPGLVPRFPQRQHPTTIHTGDLVTNNLHIKDSSIGVLNTGTISSVDNAVGTLYSSGDAAAADAFKGFTEALVGLEEADSDQKNQLLELVSMLSAEATLPASERRKAPMRALIAEVANITSGVAALAALYAQFFPAIQALFA